VFVGILTYSVGITRLGWLSLSWVDC